MKQAVLIKTDGTVRALVIHGDFNEFVHKALNCECYECVRGEILGKAGMLLVDVNGRLKGLAFNQLASFMDGSFDSDTGIVGDALIVNVKKLDTGKTDLDGLLPGYAQKLVKFLRSVKWFLPLLSPKGGQ